MKPQVYTVTYDHSVYKPSNYDVYKEQQTFSLRITAMSLRDAKNILREEHNLNPFYFKFDK